MTTDAAAQAVFMAGLPTGKNGQPTPGHTRWEDLGTEAQDRYRRMAQAAIDYMDDKQWAKIRMPMTRDWSRQP